MQKQNKMYPPIQHHHTPI